MSDDKNFQDILITEGVNTFGYGILPKMIMQDKRLKVHSKAIYAYICTFAGAGKTAFPSTKKIMSDLLIKDITTFSTNRDKLVKYGYITLERKRVSGGKYGSYIYTLKNNPKQVETSNKSNPSKSDKTQLGQNPSSIKPNFKSNSLKDSFKSNSLKDIKSTTKPKPKTPKPKTPKKKKIVVVDTSLIDILYKDIKDTIKVSVTKKRIQELLTNFGEQEIRKYISNWESFKDIDKKTVSGYFVDAVKNSYDIPVKEVKQHNKSDYGKHTEFEQRTYSDGFYESLYENGN